MYIVASNGENPVKAKSTRAGCSSVKLEVVVGFGKPIAPHGSSRLLGQVLAITVPLSGKDVGSGVPQSPPSAAADAAYSPARALHAIERMALRKSTARIELTRHDKNATRRYARVARDYPPVRTEETTPPAAVAAR